MNVNQINSCLSSGKVDEAGVFPHLDGIKHSPCIFDIDFGMPTLTTETGIILIRGARQYGKSTWLEGHLRQCILDFGPGSAFYLNGDEIRMTTDLTELLRSLVALFRPDAQTKRIYIDEITAVPDWQRALKRLADAGELRDVLIITTGSKASDLRHGTERLPGRKGTLSRTSYYFTPISFNSFLREAGPSLGDDTLHAYILSGGCPLAAAEVIKNRRIPGYIIEMIRDWILGECSASGRDRSSLIGIMDVLIRYGGSPTGQAKIAREAGLANNTVAAGYLELLMDNLCLSTVYSWDRRLNVPLRRKPAKYHFINLLSALAWHPDHPVSLDDFRTHSSIGLGKWYEWLTAQEIWRRAALEGREIPELMTFWQSKEQEIDFVIDGTRFVEVKHGKASPIEFAWFARDFPGHTLTVINPVRFETGCCRGITMSDFLTGNL